MVSNIGLMRLITINFQFKLKTENWWLMEIFKATKILNKQIFYFTPIATAPSVTASKCLTLDNSFINVLFDIKFLFLNVY